MDRILNIESRFVAAAIGLLLAGCSAFTPPIEKPIIEDRSHASAEGAKVAVFSTTAARRSVLVHFARGAAAAQVCAEAPPDAADALISSLAVSAQLKAKKGTEAEGEAQAELKRELATTVNALLDRSQGLQLFRDGAFHLCLARQNGAIKDAEYAAQYSALLSQTADLIRAEIAAMEARNARRAAQAAADSQSASDAAAARAEKAAADARSAAKDAAGTVGDGD